LSQSTAAEGSAAFTLTVSGAGFDSTATVLWNGTPLTTHFVSATQLQAQLPASLLAEEGSATVSLTEDAVTSAGLPFAITDAPLSGLTITTPGGLTESTVLSGFTVATFRDADTSAPLTDFTAVIHWGDGTSSTITSANGLSGSGGSFVVQASHTY